jgi:hypothetical protein
MVRETDRYIEGGTKSNLLRILIFHFNRPAEKQLHKNNSKGTIFYYIQEQKIRSKCKGNVVSGTS